ncbi:MAG: hypothetical protein LBF22_00055 [Deltaproteobacteria bacterium]|nr:hypothetical protein [Deltaproteobacteria bacterium]
MDFSKFQDIILSTQDTKSSEDYLILATKNGANSQDIFALSFLAALAFLAFLASLALLSPLSLFKGLFENKISRKFKNRLEIFLKHPEPQTIPGSLTKNYITQTTKNLNQACLTQLFTTLIVRVCLRFQYSLRTSNQINLEPFFGKNLEPLFGKKCVRTLTLTHQKKDN